MPNWCYNNVTLKANNVGNRALLKEVAVAANEGKEIFNLLRPMPENIFRGNLGMKSVRNMVQTTGMTGALLIGAQSGTLTHRMCSTTARR